MSRIEIEKYSLENEVFKKILESARSGKFNGSTVPKPTASANVSGKTVLLEFILENLKNQTDLLEQQTKQNLQNLSVLNQVNKQKTLNIKKQEFHWRRDVLARLQNKKDDDDHNPSVLSNPQDLMLQKKEILRFMESEILRMDEEILSLMKRSDALMAKNSKNSSSSSNAFQFIDFHQAQIENQQLNAQYADLCLAFKKLRRTTAADSLALAEVKQKIRDTEKKQKILMNNSRNLRKKFEEEKMMVEVYSKSIRDMERKLAKMRTRLEDQETEENQVSEEANKVDLLVFIKQESEMQRLMKQEKDLKRKVEIKCKHVK
jgi:Domain of unknown function (DUF4201)